MTDDLVYFLYLPLAALLVGVITLGGASFAYFSEERWGARHERETQGRDPLT